MIRPVDRDMSPPENNSRIFTVSAPSLCAPYSPLKEKKLLKQSVLGGVPFKVEITAA